MRAISRAVCAVALAALGALVTLAACSSDDSGASSGGDAQAPDGSYTNDGAGGVDSGDAGTGGDTSVEDGGGSDVFPAFTPPVPQVLSSDGGHVLASPTLVPVYFTGETLAPTIATALTDWTSSAAYTAQTSEYGIGAATVAQGIQLTESAAMSQTLAQVQGWLADKLDGTHPEFGAVDATTLSNELFLLYYPSTTTLTIDGATSCSGFDAYHDEVSVGGTPVAFAALPRCGTTMVAQNLVLATTSITMDALGDPHDESGPAYADVDPDHDAWQLALGNSELGAMCTYASPDPALGDAGLLLARSWSNAAARAYHDPCVPSPASSPYFVAVPIMTDDVTVGATTTKGVLVPAGQEKTIDVELLSDGPTSGAWTVSAASDYSALTLTLDQTTGENGDTLHLTIHSTSTTLTTFYVLSSLAGRDAVWFGAVGPN